MIMPGESKTETSRAVFVIDDKQIIRAIIYYPLSTGRNMDEILRLVQALQTTDKHDIATPANWRPGDKVIVLPPKTQEMAEEKMKEKNLECFLTPEEIAGHLGLPLFRIRRSLRELVQAGLVLAQGDRFLATKEGKRKAEAA